jgi:PAS domain-containing protein
MHMSLNKAGDERPTRHSKCGFDTLQAIRLKVVEASPDAKIVVNKWSDIVDMNEEAEFLFGYTRADL